MKQSIKQFLATLAAMIIGLVVPLAISTPVHALFEGAKGQATCGANLDGGTSSAGCTDNTDSSNKVSSTLGTVINLLSIITGIIAVIMIIIGGIRYVMSGGDGSSTTNARNTIIYAAVGLVIAALAQVIVHFVIDRVA